jgi:hypothetical protein
MEIRKEGYKNPVEAVARELMGPGYLDRRASGDLTLRDYAWEYSYEPWVKTYLPLLRAGLDPKHVSGRDEVSFSHNALAAATANLKREFQDAAEGVSWTVALAILDKDPALEVAGLHPVYKRYLFDLSLGVVVEDSRQRHEIAKRNIDYGVVRVRREDWSDIWQTHAEYYATFQQKLREPLAVADSRDSSKLVTVSA